MDVFSINTVDAGEHEFRNRTVLIGYRNLTATKLVILKNKRSMRRLGWDYLMLWKCHLSRVNTISKRVRSFLDKT